MEEMTACAVKAQNSEDVHIQIYVVFSEDSAVFVMIDDGECTALDKAQEVQELITDNYGLMKKVAKSAEYKYILQLNYTRLTFSAK